MPRIATERTPDRAGLLEFLRPRHRALLITTRRDGRPQVSPVTCGLDGQGRIVVSSYPGRAKTRNARRDGRVALCVLSDDWDGPHVQVDGRAEVLDVPEAVEPLVDYYRGTAGEHPDWDGYRAAMLRQDKVLIRVQVERWGPIATGGFPAAAVPPSDPKPGNA
ncbi:PPOX class F420-dependent oxidoreductase [Actinosynnema sp. NPDC023587]|uniref:PPOX class F420-dependent oxidoreductase n=1 Tax=Actinosynnema sp. NPDC023587 TaxID=3154695 RepID=UPI0033CB03AB